jgi:hypothetical protein
VSLRLSGRPAGDTTQSGPRLTVKAPPGIRGGPSISLLTRVLLQSERDELTLVSLDCPRDDEGARGARIVEASSGKFASLCFPYESLVVHAEGGDPFIDAVTQTMEVVRRTGESE